jgi:hypothetical protein
MDWGDIEKLINLERTRGNPVAEIIVELKFKQGKVVLGLQEEEDEEQDTGDETDDEQDIKTGKIVHIEVDLGLSAWANAREYFDKKKVAAEKVYLIFYGLLTLIGNANCAVIVEGS